MHISYFSYENNKVKTFTRSHQQKIAHGKDSKTDRGTIGTNFLPNERMLKIAHVKVNIKFLLILFKYFASGTLDKNCACKIPHSEIFM